jgi:hypothetical protein
MITLGTRLGLLLAEPSHMARRRLHLFGPPKNLLGYCMFTAAWPRVLLPSPDPQTSPQRCNLSPDGIRFLAIPLWGLFVNSETKSLTITNQGQPCSEVRDDGATPRSPERLKNGLLQLRIRGIAKRVPTQKPSIPCFLAPRAEGKKRRTFCTIA